MTFTINDADRRAKDLAAATEAAAQQIITIENKKAELEQRRDAAKLAGDIDGFRAANAELAAVAEETEVAQAHLDHIKSNSIISREEAAEAWRQYADTYNAAFRKKLDNYEKMRAELLDKYRDLIDLQAAACEIRERLARYAGMDIKHNHPRVYDAAFPCVTIPCHTCADNGPLLSLGGTTIKDPDAVFYLAEYAAANGLNTVALYADKRAQAVGNLIQNHISAGNI